MNNKAEQYYPTYKSGSRDILLLEFDEAQKIANGQTKVYGHVTNILLAIVAVVFSLFINKDDNKISETWSFFQSNSILFALILFAFGAILLRYFVELQRQITVNARKVVTLRTLLGLDYGKIQLTLPNWRVEGATNPFAIKYFNGWTRFESMPFWVLTISINLIWWLTTNDKIPIVINIYDNYLIHLSWFWGYIIITLTYLFIFRRSLNDRHETNYLNLVKIISSILRIKLVDNFEYIIYRAKLSFIEIDRLKVNYDKLKKIVVDIEDKDFYKKRGYLNKSLIRAAISQIKFLRHKLGYIESGGSTITMQLTRSLFIPPNQNRFRRKISEILLSIWLKKQFTKEEILKFYIASVRYEKGVLGLSNAVKHFFGELKDKKISNEEAFFLAERLSNVTSTVKWDRIWHLTKRTNAQINKEKLEEIYKRQINLGKLK